MTESERILKSGIIDSSFLEQQTRDGYLITEKMKKVWAVELDLLHELDRVCREEGLTYWVAYGTLLGAVRHGGFIPWDDDIDIWMPRKDYEKLIQLGKNCFCDPYFLQTTLNDNDYYCSLARLRNSNTTGFFISKNNRCNNGIYMDIFPLDEIEKSKALQFLKSVKIRFLNFFAQTYTYNSDKSKIEKLLQQLLKVTGFSNSKAYYRVNYLAQHCISKNPEMIGEVVYSYFPFYIDHFNREDFNQTVLLDFESLKVPAPIGYKRVLENRYGDYMLLPPEESRGKWHSFMFEPDLPYSQVIKLEH